MSPGIDAVTPRTRTVLVVASLLYAAFVIAIRIHHRGDAGAA